MSIFSKFFSKRTAPNCEIYSQDAQFVTEEDMTWWSKVTENELKLWVDEDVALKFALFSKLLQEGLSQLDAGDACRVAFPSYYLTINDLTLDKYEGNYEDASLPYVLKNRVNLGVAHGGLITVDSINKSSSVNALVRSLIRVGKI